VLTWPGGDKTVLFDASGRANAVALGEQPPARLQARATVGRQSHGDNMLIRGDNLPVMAALLATYEGKVKLAYLDPPFNTDARFEHYDDALPEGLWLSMMRDRLNLVHRLLGEDGTVVVHIDFRRLASTQLLLDDVFGRDCFCSLISWQRAPERTVLGQGSTPIVTLVEYLLVYGRTAGCAGLKKRTRLVPAGLHYLKSYNLILRDLGSRAPVAEVPGDRGRPPTRVWRHTGAQVERLSTSLVRSQPQAAYNLWVQNHHQMVQSVSIHPENTFQRRLLDVMDERGFYSAEYVPSRGKRAGRKVTSLYLDGRRLIHLRDYSVVRKSEIYRWADMSNLWRVEEIGVTGTSSEGGVTMRRGKKPERLLQRVLSIASSPGDLVLDPFAGSGTTGAVAQKMGRRWIMIELGSQAESMCLPRLTRVVEGRDPSGVSSACDWKGGGGFSFYLGPPYV